jgi:hypothetical protein
VKWRITTHAVDRWRERVEPEATAEAARAQMTDLLRRAKHVGQDGRGQVYRVPHPSKPLVVVTPCHDYHLVATVLTDEQWRKTQDRRPTGAAIEGSTRRAHT